MATISSAAIETMVPRRCTSVTNRNRRATALLQSPEQDATAPWFDRSTATTEQWSGPDEQLLNRYFLISSYIFNKEDRRGKDRALHVDVPGRIRRRTRGRAGPGARDRR